MPSVSGTAPGERALTIRADRVAHLPAQERQAIIRADGTVGDVQVLRTNRPQMGFEEAAISAVREWMYKPALQNGRPVEVYFTVFVEFKLH